MKGKTQRRRPLIEYVQQIIKDLGCGSYIQMKSKARMIENNKMGLQTNLRREIVVNYIIVK